MIGAALDKATIARVVIGVSEACQVKAEALLEPGEGGSLGFARVMLCSVLAERTGGDAADIGVRLGFWRFRDFGRVLVDRYRSRKRSERVLDRVRAVSSPGGVSAAIRRRLREQLAPPRPDPEQLMKMKPAERDQALIDDFLARKGVTKCEPGQALGLSPHEVQFGVLGGPAKSLRKKVAADVAARGR